MYNIYLLCAFMWEKKKKQTGNNSKFQVAAGRGILLRKC